MDILEKARMLADHIQHLMNADDFVLVKYTDNNYHHMGATITDAILQAGINYDAVVSPRVSQILKIYPEAVTTSAFYRLMQEKGPKEVLSWSDDEKPNRVVALTKFLLNEGIETEEQLREWISQDLNSSRILKVRGVGPKTADYIKILVGMQSVAVDRYIFRFLEEAGIPAENYEDAQKTVSKAADILKIKITVLDHSIWKYMKDKNKIKLSKNFCKN